MSQVQDTAPPSGTEPTSSEPAPDRPCDLMAQADAELGVASGTGTDPHLDGPSLLHHAQAPNGRRSLFRR